MSDQAPATPTKTEILTGSTGTAPVQDGSIRGLIVAAIQSVAGVLLVDELGVLDAEQMLTLAPAFTLLGFVVWALYDKLRTR